ncbi:MAG: DUF3108 domain-containing protein [Deltaproteobacteria bacterium]|nr:DUF3108 domain-containing protein [Deltaproteobacteria bacterium]MBM4325043.1 DUF3108 domain-containing protein [Deltaproteobacteria bacterium]MBM4347135.1 DUF3108 domain-containing protein [Deltaproteobacteria bacterium]
MAAFTRRNFFRWILGCSLLPALPFYLRETEASSFSASRQEGKTIGEFFKGEELSYEIGFWLFKKAALGKLTFKEMDTKGRYMAILQTETMGILGYIARYRVDIYRSIMEELDGGKRLRAITFEEDVKVGEKLRKRTHLFDYQRMKWVQTRRRKDGTLAKTEEAIPPGKTYDDFVTASYNFRYGVYGEIERGKKYVVSTFPKKGPSNYEVRVAAKEEEEKRKKSEKLKDGKDYFVKLLLDPEITHSQEGLIEGWLSKDLYPMEGTIKDVVLFGDVTGRLISKVRSI